MTDSPGLAVAALKEIAKLLDKLTADQLTDLVEGRAIVEFRSPEATVASARPKKAVTASTPTAPIDLEGVIQDIKELTREDDVENYLKRRDKELTLAALQELARRLGPPVSPKGTKAVVRKNIAAGTAGLLNRPASMFASAWES